jgi:hypothetical protein
MTEKVHALKHLVEHVESLLDPLRFQLRLRFGSAS